MKWTQFGRILLAASLIAVPGFLAQAQESQELSVKHSDRFGKYLADAQGRAVYAFTADAQSAKSNCYDDCAEAWPPVEAGQSAGTSAADSSSPAKPAPRDAFKQQPGDLPSDIMKRMQAKGEHLNPATVSSTERKDGVTQFTYFGRPLYYYEKDTEAGQTLGQGVEDAGGEWYLVAPDGALIEDEQ